MAQVTPARKKTKTMTEKAVPSVHRDCVKRFQRRHLIASRLNLETWQSVEDFYLPNVAQRVMIHVIASSLFTLSKSVWYPEFQLFSKVFSYHKIK